MENTAECTEQHISSFSQSSCPGIDVAESLSVLRLGQKWRTSSLLLMDEKRIWALKDMQLTGKVGPSLEGLHQASEVNSSMEDLTA